MDKLYIVCVDDQREVLNVLSEDLIALENKVQIEECESVVEAWEIIESIDNTGDHVALVISDQVMPENSGVDLLKKLNSDSRFQNTRKILLTGLATHQDTIEAINTAHLDNYIEKPWDRENLLQIIKVLMTKYIFSKGLDYKEFVEVTDQNTVYDLLRKTT